MPGYVVNVLLERAISDACAFSCYDIVNVL